MDGIALWICADTCNARRRQVRSREASESRGSNGSIRELHDDWVKSLRCGFGIRVLNGIKGGN